MLKSGVILETSLVTPQVSFRPPNLVGEVRGRSRTGRLWRSRWRRRGRRAPDVAQSGRLVSPKDRASAWWFGATWHVPGRFWQT